MERYRITFEKEQIVYEAEKGMTLLEAEIAAGLVPDAPCGGAGKCGKCRVVADGEKVLACRTRIDRDMMVDTDFVEEDRVQILIDGCERQVSLSVEDLPPDVERPLLVGIDLGSTTIVGYLLDGQSGERLAVKSMLNPQRQYGADVVMRSNYAMENGMEILSGCVRMAVSVMLKEMAAECGRNEEDIVRIVMVGNSCMHHLFLEIPVDTLVLAPYVPRVKDAMAVKALDLRIMVHPEAMVYWLPNIGGFVGADTVGCILASGLEKKEKMTLMVDIGTNGEIVLGNRDGMIACSTAAGPAFEGAKIACGMRGSLGAIDHVYLEDGQMKYHVIGDETPVGICGSGLLDAAACMLDLGLVDESGRMEETYYFTPNVYICQKDIRELQLAKAAIAAGIRILLDHRGVAMEDVGELLLAGAFGNYLNPVSACRIGLLPQKLSDRIVPVGNAAGTGAQIAAINSGEYERSSQLARETEFLELAHLPDFQDIYVEELEFYSSISMR